MEPVLTWFDTNPDRYWLPVCAAIIAILLVLVRPMLRRGWADAPALDLRWGWAIFIMLAVGRWPSWFATREFNPDESQFIAGALTLRHDPVFWRSVDGATAGPLDFYALLPVGWIGGGDSYMSARITAALLIGAALVLVHMSLASTFGRQVARVSTFGAVCLESLTQHDDLIHYSSELVSMVLLAFGFFAATRRQVSPRSTLWHIAGGIALGAVPFAKLQAAPIAFALGVWWIGAEYFDRKVQRAERFRNLAALCVSSLLPLLLIGGLTYAFGQWENATISYIKYNIEYARTPEGGIRSTLGKLVRLSSTQGALIGTWLIGCAVYVPAAFVQLRSAKAEAWWMGVGSVIFLFVSALSVMTPHRAFLHYCQFLVIPGTLVIGSVAGLTMRQVATKNLRCAVLCGMLLLNSVPLIYRRAEAPSRFVGDLIASQQETYGPVARQLLRYARPGESVAVWGWLNTCFAETGLRQAIRDANSTCEILPGPYRRYFRQRYLADLRNAQPPVFVDAIGPDAFKIHDVKYRHDRWFPELADYVRQNYTLVAEPVGTRLYVRNNRLSEVAGKSE